MTTTRDPEVTPDVSSGGSLTSDALWLTIAKTVTFACTIALPVLLTRRLTPTEYGIYKQVFLVIGTATVALPLGFATSAYYFLPRDREHQSEIVFNIVLFNTLVGGLACCALLFRPTLLTLVFGGSEAVEYARLVGVAIWVWIVSSFLDVAPVARAEMKLATSLIVTMQISRVMLLLGAAAFFGSVRSLAWAMIAQGIVQVATLFWFLRSRWPGFWRFFDPSLLWVQCRYAIPLGTAGLLYTLQGDLHYYVVARRFTPDVYAVYAIGCFQLPLVWILAEAVGSIMIRHVSQLQSQGSDREIVLLTARATRKLATVYFPIYAFLLVVGKEFISCLFTPRYLASWPIFAINLTVLPFNALLLDPIVRAYAEYRHFLLRLHAGLLLALVVALGFVARSLVEVIAVVVAANLLGRLITAIKVAKRLGVGPSDVRLFRDVAKVALVTAATASVTWWVRWLLLGAGPFHVLLGCAATFLTLYSLALWLLGILTPQEREIVGRWISRWHPLPRVTERSL